MQLAIFSPVKSVRLMLLMLFYFQNTKYIKLPLFFVTAQII